MMDELKAATQASTLQTLLANVPDLPRALESGYGYTADDLIGILAAWKHLAAEKRADFLMDVLACQNTGLLVKARV